MITRSKLGKEYLPHVDGLRAVAAISVLLYHAHRSVFSGGFVGVDAFLVISGFLFTNIVMAGWVERIEFIYFQF